MELLWGERAIICRENQRILHANCAFTWSGGPVQPDSHFALHHHTSQKMCIVFMCRNLHCFGKA